ncbi:MAG: tRNA (adenosine(37)-N6)-dimethylallyltransferase MiaA, partial [Myxococcales bacterium]|nr:tRNA (adenosine(37)-N6)-dimethylallyltransferase MiaA [Myxococcales bacterium]
MSSTTLPRCVILCGPTASGKTSLSLALAHAVDGEIVNADSLQVYRGLDIGTAKVSQAERAQVPHHLFDIKNPDEPFNVALYKASADVAIEDILERGKVPIVVGGTGLYLKILVRGIFEVPKASQDLRDRLRAEIEAYGIEQLHRRLQLNDPELAEKIENHDTTRIIRGLEVFEQTGIPLSQHQRAHDFGEASYDYFSVGIKLPRTVLYERIVKRTEAMIDAGLEAEYDRLVEEGYGPDLKPLQSLGYKQ